MKRSYDSSSGTVNVATLKARLAQYLRHVKSGNEVTILEHRQPVAKIVPLSPESSLDSVLPVGSFSDRVQKIRVPAAAPSSVDSLTLLLEERGRR